MLSRHHQNARSPTTATAVSETVAQLCEQLELEPDWERWAAKDWAIEEAEAGIEGSPYVSRKRGGTGECVIEVGGTDSS